MKKMALFVFILMVVGVSSGCLGGEKKTETSTDQKTPTSEQTVETPDTPGGSQADPVFKDYLYPGSKLDGTYSTGDTMSALYISTDDVDKIVAYYTQKLQAAPLTVGSLIQFEIYNSDNHRITVGISRRNTDTQINLADWGVEE